MVVDVENISEFLEEYSLTASDEVLQKMQDMCSAHGLSAEDVVVQWVAFSARRSICHPPTVPLLQQLEKEELMKKKQNPPKSKNVTTPVYNARTIDRINTDKFRSAEKNNKNLSLLDSSNFSSPSSRTSACFTPSQKYESRNGPGNVVCSFGPSEATWSRGEGPGEKCCVRDHTQVPLRGPYPHMAEKLRDRAAILGDAVVESARLYAKGHSVEEWAPLQVPSVEKVSVIGRVCSDGPGKMNPSSLLLEGSQDMSSGHAVPLDVERVDKFSLFPGQIIAGTGINNIGKKLVMDKIYDGIHPPFETKAPELAGCSDSLSAVVACGPFATSDTFSYEPLRDLMRYVVAHRPHVLILIGPLVDIKNENIENRRMNELFSVVFDKLIKEILSKIEDLDTKVVLVPSTRDAHHDCVYPTPPYSLPQSSERLYLAPDPCILNIEGVIFAISATDILFHLGKEEISFPQQPDRLGRLCNHILTHRNFYPLHPCSEDVNIDSLRLETHAALPVMPHIMVLPSDFRFFLKDISGCCCINPERLTKHSSGGTFARIKIKPVDRDTYKGSIVDSISAQIVKI